MQRYTRYGMDDINRLKNRLENKLISNTSWIYLNYLWDYIEVIVCVNGIENL